MKIEVELTDEEKDALLMVLGMATAALATVITKSKEWPQQVRIYDKTGERAARLKGRPK